MGKYYYMLILVLILHISCSDNSNPIVSENDVSYVFAFIDGNYPSQNLIVMDLEKLTQDTLIRNMQINSIPIWSNDGNKILISSDGLIYTVNRDGGDFKWIGNKMENSGHPQWSFDDQFLVFPTEERDTNSIAVFNNYTATENYISYSEGSLGGPNSFACSPLNYNFLFVTYDKYGGIRGGNRGLYLMNFIDSTYSQITYGTSLYDPSWSHDGKMCAYGYSGGLPSGIYIKKMDNTCPKIISDGSFLSRMPKWSYDNQKISFWGKTSEDAYNLFYVNLLTEAQYIVDDSDKGLQIGSWSTDSRYIIFHRINDDENYSILVFDIISGEKTEILNSDTRLKYPIFAPRN